MGSNPSRFHEVVDLRPPGHLPIEGLTWPGAREFTEKLSDLPEEQAAGRTYRLPTEAEWEYACRAWFSPTWPYHFGRTLSSTQANFNGGHEESEEPEGGVFLGPAVGRRVVSAQRFSGFTDLHGNLAEWCQELVSAAVLRPRSPRQDPRGAHRRGTSRILRGGAWGDQGARPAARRGASSSPPTPSTTAMGVRVVMALGVRRRDPSPRDPRTPGVSVSTLQPGALLAHPYRGSRKPADAVLEPLVGDGNKAPGEVYSRNPGWPNPGVEEPGGP